MSSEELSPRIRGELSEILSSAYPDEPRKFTKERAVEACDKLLIDEKTTLLAISEFKAATTNGYFSENPSTVVFYAGRTRFEISYYKKPTGEEDLVIIKDQEEKINLHKFINHINGTDNAHIIYFEAPLESNKAKHYGDEVAVAEAKRIIDELK